MQIIAICKGCDNELPIIDVFRDCGAVIRIEVDRCRTPGCDPDFCEGCEDLEPLKEDLNEANEKIEELKAEIRELEEEAKHEH